MVLLSAAQGQRKSWVVAEYQERTSEPIHFRTNPLPLRLYRSLQDVSLSVFLLTRQRVSHAKLPLSAPTAAVYWMKLSLNHLGLYLNRWNFSLQWSTDPSKQSLHYT